VLCCLNSRVAPIESLQSPPENMPLVGEIGPKVDGTRMWINTEAHGVEGNRMTQLAEAHNPTHIRIQMNQNGPPGGVTIMAKSNRIIMRSIMEEQGWNGLFER